MQHRPIRSFLALIVVCAIALPVAAYALREDPPKSKESEAERKERKVRRLFEAMNQRDVMEETTKASAEAFGKMGLPDDFTDSFLDRFDYDHMIDMNVEIYVDKLEEATIDALLAFHESEQGQVFAALLPEISVAGLRKGQKYGEDLALEIIQGK